MRPLTAFERMFFAQYGYIVLKNVVATDLCQQVLDEGWALLERRCGIFRDRPETWEGWPLSQHGFSEAWCLPGMWAMRESPEVYGYFRQLLGEERLWVSVDRLGWKRPARITLPNGKVQEKRAWNRNPYLHLDLNPWAPPQHMILQGVIALNQNDAASGCFSCVPGFHHQIDAWAAQWKAAGNPVSAPEVAFNRVTDPGVLARMVPIELEAGDLCIWDSRLPHTSLRNTSDRWRHSFYARYFSANPAHPDAAWHQQVIQDVQASLKTGIRPKLFSLKGHVPQERADLEMADYQPPTLSPLGQKLTGLVPW